MIEIWDRRLSLLLLLPWCYRVGNSPCWDLIGDDIAIFFLFIFEGTFRFSRCLSVA